MDLHEIARRQHGVFPRRQALARGLSPYRIRSALASGRWVEPARHVYVAAGTPRSAMAAIRIAYLSCPAEPVVSHVSAAWLHGLELSDERCG